MRRRGPRRTRRLSPIRPARHRLWAASGHPTAGDVWAVGGDAQILHYQGGQWTPVTSPSAASLTGIASAPDGTLWAGGLHSDSSGSVTGTLLKGEHGTWSLVTTPPLGALNGVTTAPDGSVWTAGDGPNLNDTGLANNQGGHWTMAAEPTLRGLPMRRIQMLSNTEGWAVGGVAILHYHDDQWEIVAQPKADLYGVALSPAGDAGWAVGAGGAIFQYHAGAWTATPSPTDLGLRQVAWVSADEAWAVGGADPSNARGIILHYTQGVWRIYQP